MAFLVDEAYLPAVLTVGPMSDEQFVELCAQHPDLSFEVTAEGDLIVMPQAVTMTGARNSEIGGQLRDWARQQQLGLTFDSSTGWVLPNGARRSPDAAWVSRQRARSLGDPGGFWRLCPEFVIELKSESGRMRALREKMTEWITNGAQLAWLIDPETRTVEIYRPGVAVEVLMDPREVAGEGPVDGFVLKMAPVWNPLQG